MLNATRTARTQTKRPANTGFLFSIKFANLGALRSHETRPALLSQLVRLSNVH